MKKNVVAIDLGGSSGRVVLGDLAGENLTFKEVHRFKDYTLEKNNHLYWDINKIFNEIIYGLKLVYSIAPNVESIGIDTWGVDFGLIKKDGTSSLPFCYRDKYTKETYQRIQQQLGTNYLFERAGLQSLAINSLFQLVAQNKQGKLDDAQFFLLIPDLLNYMLTGVIKTELSIASTTQLLNPAENKWDECLLKQLELPLSIFPEIVSSGNILGVVSADVLPELPFDKVKVINVAAHDTASASYSIPDLREQLFLSSGTWSLLGLEVEEPIITKETMEAGFSNEKSASGKTLLLKNLTGLWLIEEAIKDYQKMGEIYDYQKIAQIINLAEERTKNLCVFDTEDSIFTIPGGILEKIQQFAEKTKQRKPITASDIFESIYKSLAFKYRDTLEELEGNPDLKIEKKQLVIVGGGSKSEILCQYTANALNKEIKSGLAEATAIGNCLMQFKINASMSEKQVEKIKQKTANFKRYKPEKATQWQTEYLGYKKMMEGVQNELSKNRYSTND